jgi:cellulose synthase/poly-beta-1,6-N-acetylglucosamine synthase-like glycosyltransferase
MCQEARQQLPLPLFLLAVPRIPQMHPMIDLHAPANHNDRSLSAAAGAATAHISVCICTYKRPKLLRHLLDQLTQQQTDGLFSFSVVVVDNDSSRSAEAEVLDFLKSAEVFVDYYVESRQSISLARNKAVENSQGDFIAFIDDDEFPSPTWLLTLFTTLRERKVDGVLGPVMPFFKEGVPEWVVKGGFYDRPAYATGLVVDGKKGRTGNVLLRRQMFVAQEQPFRPEFRSGEDQDFFARMIQEGYVFIWCNEAIAYEVVPEIRWKRAYMLRKALLQGACSIVKPEQRALSVAKSILAIPLYTAALPFVLLFGQCALMILLVKLFDHSGRVLAAMGINVVKQAYVTE